MQTGKGSFSDLQALLHGRAVTPKQGSGMRKLSRFGKASAASLDSDSGRRPRMIICANQLPLRVKEDDTGGYLYEWDEDSVIGQAKEGVPKDLDTVWLGTLPVEIDANDHDDVADRLFKEFSCHPVFVTTEIRNKYYKGFCKHQLWPLLHSVLPMAPRSVGRFDEHLWQAYVRANMMFAEALVALVSVEMDYVWVHDYHLLVLPSMLRRKFSQLRCGFFLHSPFPSSEVFRTFPRREELLRAILNADAIGFHTFDYARHFLSCCSRVLGLEHRANRGRITLDYYGRSVSVKIMPTGVEPSRLLAGFSWPETQWRRGELLSQFRGRTVLVGVDDMDVLKGIEQKLLALERLLQEHPEWIGKLTLVQITNAPRSTSVELQEYHEYVKEVVERINTRFGNLHSGYWPVEFLERHVPLHERIAFYSVADAAVVTATRDGLNLVPYEYICCRQGPGGSVPNGDALPCASALVVSEFVGCSPSLSGALRVNPWSIDSVKEGIYTAITMPQQDQKLAHEKHWRYVSLHTVAYWAQSYVQELQFITSEHGSMRTYGLGLGLDTFRTVALGENFRKLEVEAVLAAMAGAARRLVVLDHDAALASSGGIARGPSPEALAVLQQLTKLPGTQVYVLAARGRACLQGWYGGVEGLGLAAEHGYFVKPPHTQQWLPQADGDGMVWKDTVRPIMMHYTEYTDGCDIEDNETSLVWHYHHADPDFGATQAKELLQHLDSVLGGEAVCIGNAWQAVEVRPSGVSKGATVRRLLEQEAWGFVLCIADDTSSDDMFASFANLSLSPSPADVQTCQTFVCTVGQRPSQATYYLDDCREVLSTLEKLAEAPWS